MESTKKYVAEFIGPFVGAALAAFIFMFLEGKLDKAE